MKIIKHEWLDQTYYFKFDDHTRVGYVCYIKSFIFDDLDCMAEALYCEEMGLA